MPRRLRQAYRQAPWRIQTQRGAMLLIVAILGASVLWVMLSVSVQAASAGLEIQKLEDQQDELQRKIAALNTEIAALTATDQMADRADKLGFKPVKPEDITYIVIPGFTGRAPLIQALPPSATIQQPLVKPAYTQSLWEWLKQGILEFNSPPGGITP